MIAAAALAILFVGAPILPPSTPATVGVVPDEPGAFALPEVPTVQAVAADVDGDGIREIVRLVEAEQGALDAEVWRMSSEGWRRVEPSVNVVPVRTTGVQGNIVYAGAPVRLVVRSVDGIERATVIRQPRFEEPALEVDCCLRVDDLVVVDGLPRLIPVARPGLSADAVLALDMDGDRTDELLVTRSLPALGDTTFPTAVWVYRWTGEAFAPPVRSEIPVGSGFAPFLLGDSDGIPGDEAAFIGVQARLHRVSLREGDTVVAESAESMVRDALAVPIGEARGLAVMGTLSGLSIRTWPRDQPMGEPLPAETVTEDGRLLGVVTNRGRPYLAVQRLSTEALHLLELPTLAAIGGPTVTRSPAAGTLAAGPVAPFVGRMPGGGLDGEAAVVYAGHLIPSGDRPGAPFATLDTALLAALPGARPIGLVGPDRAWLAILHVPFALEGIDPTGGRLEPPHVQFGAGVTVAPVDLARAPERDDGVFAPELEGVAVEGRDLVVGAAGFTAVIEAPPGSRVYPSESDPSVVGQLRVVPESGLLRVRIARDVQRGPPNPRYRALLAVTTPAGHGYLAAWDVQVLTQPPALAASACTPLGSAAVVVSGETDPLASVRVDGVAVGPDAAGRFRADVPMPPWPTTVEVVATDPVGNQARLTVSGVGWFDYRGLPWVPISVGLVVVAGVVLLLRVPRLVEAPRAAGDDAALEELDSAEEP